MKKTTVMLLAVAAVSLPAAAGSETLNLVPWPKHMELGRGFLALAAVSFGERKPFKCLVATLVFGFADALAVRLQQFGLPSQLVLMLPYIVTIVVLTLSSIQRIRAQRAKQPAGV